MLGATDASLTEGLARHARRSPGVEHGQSPMQNTPKSRLKQARRHAERRIGTRPEPMLKPRIPTVQVSHGTMRDVPCSFAALALAAQKRPRHYLGDGVTAWCARGAPVPATMLERHFRATLGGTGSIRIIVSWVV